VADDDQDHGRTGGQNGEAPDGDTPGGEQSNGEPDQGGRHARGAMRFQDESTTPREPTLAEKKAREQAERRREEAERQEAAEAERSRKKRKRILIGAGVTVGVVAVIAIGYAASRPDEEVQAQCIGDDGVVVDESNCVTPAGATNNTYYGGGGFFPIFIGAGGRQYHYNYGGTGSIGQQVSGGTTTVPKDGTRVTTSSGKTISGSSSSVSRGGLGSSSGSGSGSGSSSGS
jgi:hypothetical protein